MASHCTNIAGPTPGSKDMKRLPGGGALRSLDQVQCFKVMSACHLFLRLLLSHYYVVSFVLLIVW
jgi:hypothetical protein